MKLAVFDCDGTLIDGQASICDAMETAFASVGMALPDRNQVRRIVGLSLPQAARRLAPDASAQEAAQIVDAYKQAFRAAREEGSLAQPLFVGMREVLDALTAQGWLLGVATGMSQRGLLHCLATHGLSQRFVTLQTADHHPSKPHPAMLEQALSEAAAQASDAVMIGDTAYDMQMAQSAGVRGVGVAWGYHEPDELLGAGGAFVAETPAQLLEYLLA